MAKDVSGLMVAYNAAGTIERALASALAQVDHLILVDDGSQDNTVNLARGVSASCLDIVKLKENQGIGYARQVAVDRLARPVGCWLDADDIWLPERIAKLKTEIVKGADYVLDEAEVVDEASQIKLCDAHFPDFLLMRDGFLYQYGRNYLPTLGHPMARATALKKIGYKWELKQAEDYDHFMRALASQCTMKFSRGLGYREYCSVDSASRSLDRQNYYSKKSLMEIEPDHVFQSLRSSCLPGNDQNAVFMMFLTRQESWLKLTDFAERCINLNPDSDNAWLYTFYYGVGLYHQDNVGKAIKCFQHVAETHALPEALNNIGACRKKLGLSFCEIIDQALNLKTDYLDALANRDTARIVITKILLRTENYRGRYHS